MNNIEALQIKSDPDGDLDLVLKEKEILCNRQEIAETIAKCQREGFCYPVTFVTHERILIPDVEGCKGYCGVSIIDHIFFFTDEMCQDWANDICIQFQSKSAYYIGLEQEYVFAFGESALLEPKLQTTKFTPEELAAWLNLFWSDKSNPSFFPRSQDEFLVQHGSNF